jgi:hypothetical protein
MGPNIYYKWYENVNVPNWLNKFAECTGSRQRPLFVHLEFMQSSLRKHVHSTVAGDTDANALARKSGSRQS